MKHAGASVGDARSTARAAHRARFGAAAALLALSIGTCAAGTPEGLAALERSDYASAQRELAPMAEQGDHEAQFALGRMLLYGWGVKRDPQAAVRWFTAAAEGGNAAAQNLLGTLLAQGTGIDADPQQGLRWFREAAKRGDADAPRNLGAMYELGLGVDVDYREARAWYGKAPGDDAIRAANRVDLLIGWQGLEWGTPLAKRPGFAPTQPPAMLERSMSLQRLLSGRPQYAFYVRRGDSTQFGGATVKRIVYQSLTQRDGLCAVWMEFEGRSNHLALLRTLASWYGTPHAQTSLDDDRLSMRAWDFRGGVRVLLEHFQWAAADESLGWLAVWHASC